MKKRILLLALCASEALNTCSAWRRNPNGNAGPDSAPTPMIR